MYISAKADYAMRALLELAATTGGGPVKGETLARSQDLPVKFLENVLLSLRRAGIVGSQRGTDGGYRLLRKPEDVAVADVIRAVEGPLAEVRGLRPEDTMYGGAATHLQDVWVAVRASLRSVLETTTLADVLAGKLPPRVRKLLEHPDAYISRI